ncbi:MAG: ATP-grasp fold amidoligase family protein [Pleomorphochaeta sp.]
MIKHLLSKLKNLVFIILTIISPKLNTKCIYRYYFKKKLNLKNPKSFVEKLLYLKLFNYNNNKLVIQCADKYLVRNYVKQCGYQNILNKVYSVYDKPSQINFEELPNEFVLKWNFGAGNNIFCKDKSMANQKEIIQSIRRYGQKKTWLLTSEMHYKHIPKKIICEKYLSSQSDNLTDYKIYCFNSKALMILVMQDRYSNGGIRASAFDINWNLLKDQNNKYRPIIPLPKKPKSLSCMLEIAENLSKPFPFVRVDLYEINDRPIFGELTFTPAGCLFPFQILLYGKEMGDYLII